MILRAISGWSWLWYVPGLAIAAAALWVLPSSWRTYPPGFARRPAWWPYGDVSFRAWRRGMVVGTLGFAVALLAFLPLLVLETIFGTQAPLWLAWIAASSMLAGGALMLSVGLFNRPRFAVPPYLRRGPGAVKEWADRRRKTRAGRDGT